jgi:hypothetical protein
MANSENWSYVNADLQPGKHYYIKANMFPGFMMARTETFAARGNGSTARLGRDPRIALTWKITSR